jgi:transposase InsO family protein
MKMMVLGAVETAEGRTITERIKKVSQMTFFDEDGDPHQFTWRTIQTWKTRYNTHGHAGVTSKPRRDKGTRRKMPPEQILEAVEQAKPYLREGYKITDLYRVCIEKGLLQRNQIAPNTFRRAVNQYEMLKDDDQTEDKKRLAFAKAHANEMWQGDTMIGPYVETSSGKKKQAKLIAFIDDASRLLCHGQFVLDENTHALKKSLRNAFYKRGIPDSLYFDNGSIYSCKDITLICARLGCLVLHTPVRDGAAKGKIERFFRTVRDQFLSKNLDLSSTSALNKQFNLWVEKSYNHRVHSTIGLKPIDRFGLDLKRIRYLTPNPHNDEIFYHETKRSVIADNTFQANNIRYEAPTDLRNRKIQLRYNTDESGEPTGIPIVYLDDKRQGEARRLLYTTDLSKHPFYNGSSRKKLSDFIVTN